MRDIFTVSEKMLADTLTPVSAYLKLRDVYPRSVLLESTDFHHLENCYSFICIKPMAGFTVMNEQIVTWVEDEKTVSRNIDSKTDIPGELQDFIFSFSFSGQQESFNSFFGHIGYSAVRYFEDINLEKASRETGYPDIRFSLYKYVIAFNHLKNEIQILENLYKGESPSIHELRSVLFNNKIPEYGFSALETAGSNMTDDEYMSLVTKAKEHCMRGDVFQIVLSRSYSRAFHGDDFQVYRNLRSLNPSPYLFYFDYGDYKIFGSSPESQIVIKDGRAYINPIAGTFGRTGNDERDKELSLELSEDPKENAEHVMLVDLARNDLARNADDVRIENYKEIHFYSHVIHIVSKVSGRIKDKELFIKTISDSFPAGTLSGAPKYKAIELIDRYEPGNRGFYGGCIGLINPAGEANLAITIRSFLSRNNTLFYQAGAGIVNSSVEEKELAEVNHKLEALKAAVETAGTK
ncbi:MAG: anthranilate synthase component I family protein [Bacteroidales bacterium]